MLEDKNELYSLDQGRDWARVQVNELHGMICFHGDDDSGSVAKTEAEKTETVIEVGGAMGPFAYSDPMVKKALTNWFAQSGEIVVELYVPHSGGGGAFFALTAYSQFEHLIATAKPNAICFALRERQLPIRGEVRDNLTSLAIQQIADGRNYLVVKPSHYPAQLAVLADGKSHAQLRTDLENLWGEEVWIGPEFEMPNEYWKENTATDALIVMKGRDAEKP